VDDDVYMGEGEVIAWLSACSCTCVQLVCTYVLMEDGSVEWIGHGQGLMPNGKEYIRISCCFRPLPNGGEGENKYG
jgi:hypothetical protein